MKILLINQNAIVEKLVRLSAQRIGLELTIADSFGAAATGGYEWLFVDHESIGGETIATLRAKFPGAKIGLLYPKTGGRLDGFDLYIEKPFLPTELIDEFSSKMKAPEKADELQSIDGFDAGELGSLGDLGDLGDLGSLDDIGDLAGGAGDLSAGDLGGDMAKIDEIEPLEQLEPLAETSAETADTVTDVGKAPADADLGELSAIGDLGDLGNEIAFEPTETIEFDSQIKPLDDFAPESASQEPILDTPATEPALDDLGDLGDLDDLDTIDETPVKAAEPAGVLDMGEIQEVKGLIDEINEPNEPAAAVSDPLLDDLPADLPIEPIADEAAIEPIAVEPQIDDLLPEPMPAAEELEEPAIAQDVQEAAQEDAFDDNFGDIFEDGKDVGKDAGQGAEEELNLDFGENSALLDDDDLAAIHQRPQADNLDLDGTESQFSDEDKDETTDELLPDDLAQFEEAKTERFATPDFGEIPAFEENSAGDEELSTITEPEVAAALGEELLFAEPPAEAIAPDEPTVDEFADNFGEEFKQEFKIDEPLESVKEIAPETALTQSEQKAVAGSIAGALATLSPSTLREVLDGMQLTINISFPKK